MVGGRRLVAALPLSVLACTAQNPDFGVDAGPPCILAARQCIESLGGPTVPAVCGMNTQGKVALLREPCPAGAACQNGLCVPPPQAPACASQRDCKGGQVCVPLIGADQKLTGFCVSPRLPPGAACEKDDDCQTFLCLTHANGKFCLKACQQQTFEQDCGIPNVCRSFDVTVTGVQGTVQSCSAP